MINSVLRYWGYKFEFNSATGLHLVDVNVNCLVKKATIFIVPGDEPSSNTIECWGKTAESVDQNN